MTNRGKDVTYAEVQRQIRECLEKGGKKLVISCPDLTRIPVFPGNCPLEYLELVGNYKTIPESVGNLLQLKTLKLCSEKPITLPDSLGNLSALKKLKIYAPVINIPKSFDKLAMLEKLDLCSQDILLPKTFGHLSALKELCLDAKKMQLIPDSIGQCKKLEKVIIVSDTLSVLPESFCTLKKLKELYLDTFALKLLPAGFGNLGALKSIDVFSGMMTSLPESIGNLKNLESLYIDAYNVKKLPLSYKKLSHIKPHIDIGKKSAPLFKQPGNNKRGNILPGFNDLNNMGDKFRWKLLESYSIKELESILCSAPRFIHSTFIDRLIFKEIMHARSNKPEKHFKRTNEKKYIQKLLSYSW